MNKKNRKLIFLVWIINDDLFAVLNEIINHTVTKSYVPTRLFILESYIHILLFIGINCYTLELL